MDQQKINITFAIKNGEILHSMNKQLDKLVQHFSFLYSTQNIIIDITLNSMDSLPMMDWPATKELSKAIYMMAPWKISGSDGIIADLLRNVKSGLFSHLHDVLKC